MKPESSYKDAFHRERESYLRLFKRADQFRKVLNLIAYSSHCIYPSESPSQYETGVADGHRCAAQIAKDALREE
jgi:hypothetical protein